MSSDQYECLLQFECYKYAQCLLCLLCRDDDRQQLGQLDQLGQIDAAADVAAVWDDTAFDWGCVDMIDHPFVPILEQQQ